MLTLPITIAKNAMYLAPPAYIFKSAWLATHPTCCKPISKYLCLTSSTSLPTVPLSALPQLSKIPTNSSASLAAKGACYARIPKIAYSAPANMATYFLIPNAFHFLAHPIYTHLLTIIGVFKDHTAIATQHSSTFMTKRSSAFGNRYRDAPVNWSWKMACSVLILVPRVTPWILKGCAWKTATRGKDLLSKR